MDIISHGLWGGISFGRRNKNLYWLSFMFGIMPDLLSFGLYAFIDFIGLVSGPEWQRGPFDPKLIPEFVHTLYHLTHSLVIFLAFFLLIWFLLKRPFFPLLAWGLHILIDIPTHSASFFPTPFLYPISDFVINGISWGNPYIFFSNWVILVGLYIFWFLKKRRRI